MLQAWLALQYWGSGCFRSGYSPALAQAILATSSLPSGDTQHGQVSEGTEGVG